MKHRAALVAALRERGAIRSDEVAAAFAEVPRECFIPSILAEQGIEGVYRDEPFVTKRDQRGLPISSSSQPGIMAEMLELLRLGAGQRVLEVGAGTGYNAALIKRIVGARGAVVTIDVDPGLARSARAALRRGGYRATVVVGDGRAGWPDQAPYDRIIVTGCADRIPRAWLEQLVDGGLVVLPLRLDPDGMALQLIPAFRRQGQRLLSIGMTWGSFMALHDGDGGWQPPPEQVSAARSVRGKPPRSLGSISGGGLARLPEFAVRTLLADLIAGRGQRRAEGLTPLGRGDTPLMLVYLLRRVPEQTRVAVHSQHRIGIGVVDRRTSSLAVLSTPSPWAPGRNRASHGVRWRLDAYGGEGAALELEQLLAGWRDLHRRAGRGRANPSLRITAFGTAEQLRLRWQWS